MLERVIGESLEPLLKAVDQLDLLRRPPQPPQRTRVHPVPSAGTCQASSEAACDGGEGTCGCAQNHWPREPTSQCRNRPQQPQRSSADEHRTAEHALDPALDVLDRHLRPWLAPFQDASRDSFNLPMHRIDLFRPPSLKEPGAFQLIANQFGHLLPHLQVREALRQVREALRVAVGQLPGYLLGDLCRHIVRGG